MSALSGLKDHLIQAAATAALLATGATVVSSKIDNARQDVQLEAAMRALPEIQKDVKETREVVIRLEAQKGK
nr:hypothetical protein [uncultured Sphingomonas sp.]